MSYAHPHDTSISKITNYELQQAARRLYDNLVQRQEADGSWSAAYDGPMFLTPLYVMIRWRMGYEWTEPERQKILHYFRMHQNPDGSWGLHDEGPGQLFPTIPIYIAMRMLGVPQNAPSLMQAKSWFTPRGGALHQASWGRIFCALVGLYPWDAIEPLLPELWTLPDILPIHPSRMWCHARMVYLPMSYLYGIRSKPDITSWISELRQEIFIDPWEDIHWREAVQHTASTDVTEPKTNLATASSSLLHKLEPLIPSSVRRLALRHILQKIRAEDQNTHSICIGPINKLLHLLVWHEYSPGSRAVEKHIEQLSPYVWETEETLHIQGYESTQLWDTTFAVQALCHAQHAGITDGDPSRFQTTLSKARSFIQQQQVRQEVPSRHLSDRAPSIGGWPFSTRQHGWPITDCTAEALKAYLVSGSHKAAAHDIDIETAAQWLLSLQNRDGGWATYERTRGPHWLEALNPSDTFTDIMIDYSYVECTSACTQALVKISPHLSEERKHSCELAIERGKQFLLQQQNDDGSWRGSWGVCFSYGTWFGITGLRAAGVAPSDPAIQQAIHYIHGHQHPHGAWGEDYASCMQGRWIHSETPKAVTTSWALLSLAAGDAPYSPAMARGVQFLCEATPDDGDIPFEGTVGVFNRTCGIHYHNYRRYFPLWALSRMILTYP